MYLEVTTHDESGMKSAYRSDLLSLWNWRLCLQCVLALEIARLDGFTVVFVGAAGSLIEEFAHFSIESIIEV